LNNNSASIQSGTNLKVMIASGEASGEKHGAALAQALREMFPATEFEFFGSGGAEMRAAGIELLVDVREIATIGVVEVLHRLPRFIKAYRTLLDAARTRRPDVVVLIDWPDFNLRLAKTLHREEFRITYYISPQVWAWRGHRVRAIKRDVDQVLVILPFEEDFYRDAGISAEYVGHPLVDKVIATASRDEFCRRYQLDAGRPIISLLPGSRHSEVRHHMPLLIDTAARLRNVEFSLHPVQATAGIKNQISCSETAVGTPQFVIPLASTIDPAEITEAMGESGRGDELPITTVEKDTYNSLFHSQIAVVASGTATVEAALAGTPMVIIYRGSELNWRLFRPLIHLDTFGMVNLIAGRKVVPELIQHDATAEKISTEVASILNDPERLAQIRSALGEVRDRLRIDGASGARRAAGAVMRSISGS
jgi:lipid-A-disaccharide synthase